MSDAATHDSNQGAIFISSDRFFFLGMFVLKLQAK
jgi:hypothetical protein